MKILVADNSQLIRHGFRCILSDRKDFIVKADVSCKEELEIALSDFSPELLVIDHLSMGFRLKEIVDIKRKYKSLKILGLTTFPEKDIIFQAFSAGVSSYLLKECDKEEIIEAIHTTVGGDRFICGKILSVLTAEEEIKMNPAQVKLSTCEGSVVTERELDIIRLIAEGYSNKQIADKLFLSQHTVNTHRKNVMAKLGVNNTAGVVMYAVKNNLLEPNNLLFG